MASGEDNGLFLESFVRLFFLGTTWIILSASESEQNGRQGTEDNRIKMFKDT